MKKTYVADFETTTRENDCRVWAYAIAEVGNTDNIHIGLTIDDFMAWCENQADNPRIFFHNLKFDSQFIMYWLFKNGFKHADRKNRTSNTFTTSISDKGLYYTLEVYYKVQGRKIKKITFQDSLKLIPLSVEQIGKAFDLPEQKLEIDYKAHDNLPAGSPLSDIEKEYIKHDVIIVSKAIEYFYSQGLDKMTIGSCALNEYKKIISKRSFDRWFPEPKFHDDIKQSYKGGFTYLNPKFASKKIKGGLVLDVNSLYPSVMYKNYLPFGTPIFFKGKYKPDPIYNLYTQMFSCSFELKPGKIPTIQIKDSMFYRGNEYLTSSENKEVVLCLNNVDLELFLDHYDVYNIEYISGWAFKGTRGLFTEYIDKWSANKIKAKEEGNNGLYLISKLFLNSLYGKFGTDTKAKSKIPFYSQDEDRVKFIDGEEEKKDGIYIAMASFITSYARLKTISSAQKIMDNYNSGKSKAQFVYADTDSLHIYLNGENVDEYLKMCGLDIDSTKLGAWDHEATFTDAKFLRQKCYIEKHIIDEKSYNKGLKGKEPFLYSKDAKGFYFLKITVAGMPSKCYEKVTFNNFKIGATYEGKLQPKVVTGGTVLTDVEFTIKN